MSKTRRSATPSRGETGVHHLPGGSRIAPRRLGLLAVLPTVLAILGLGAAPAAAEEVFANPAGPHPAIDLVTNITATTAQFRGIVDPDGSETRWRLEYAPAAPGGQAPAESDPAWIEVPGGEGTISEAEAQALLGEEEEILTESGQHLSGLRPRVRVTLAGLEPGAVYFLRLFAENKTAANTSSQTLVGSLQAGEALHPRGPARLETEGPPSVTTLATHFLHGDATRLLGVVQPNGAPTDEEQTLTIAGAAGGSFTLSFEGQTTDPIPYIPHGTGFEHQENELGRIAQALQALPDVGDGAIAVDGSSAGPYTVRFLGPLGGVDQPQLSADGSGLTPSGTLTVSTLEQGGLGFDTHYHFEYVSDQDFEASGFAAAVSTPEVDLGMSGGSEVVGADLGDPTPGETYRYRLSATNTSPADPVVLGAVQILLAPRPASPEGTTSCSNQALRSAASARLPDCRAYEQVTPTEKRGAQDVFRYGTIFESTVTGADGDHFALHAPGTQWGDSPDSDQSNYFFTREAGGWQMTSATPQPLAGVKRYGPQVFSSDLTQIGIQVETRTTLNSFSPEVELEAGPPGGPYRLVASEPRSRLAGGWAGAFGDGAVLILALEDRGLAGHPTGTTSGTDLYEYEGGNLRQLNVQGGSPGTAISTCGASLAAPADVSLSQETSAGRRVFFTDNCTHDLYMRRDGEETLDIGEYHLLATNPPATELLLEREGEGGDDELLLYDTGTASARPLISAPTPLGRNFTISKNFSTLFLAAHERLTPDALPVSGSSEDIYRYNVSTASLHFIDQALPDDNGTVALSSSADGRYLYLQVRGVAGFSGAQGQAIAGIYRYDSAEAILQCITCSSGFAPEAQVDVPAEASPDGSYILFDTVVPLVPQDVDGEVEPEPIIDPHGGFSEHPSNSYSVSSDVYEWRRDGLDGCSEIQGCLSLITSGRGGFKNVLLGVGGQGRDVFLATHESLVAGDEDAAGDVYDARIDGGFPPPPPPPVECEGDACHSPPAAPFEPTLSTSVPSGPGNAKPPAKKHHHKKHHARRHHHKNADRRHANSNHGGAK